MDTNNLGDWAIGHNLYQWIVDNVESNSTVLELGSGSGTHELGKIYNVHCVEHNEKWVNKFDNLTYHYAPIKNGWYDRSKLNELPKEYSLLILDGPPGNVGRTKVLENLDLFNTNVPIIVDDTNRKVEKDLANKICEILNRNFVEIKEHNKSACVILV